MNRDQAVALRDALSEMMARIGKKEPILEQMETIGRIQAEIAPTAPAQLTHFLERRSYTKALDYLAHGVVVDDPNRPACDEEETHP